VFFYVNSSYQQKRRHCALFAQLTVASIQQIFGVPVMDSLQHEAYDEIYGIDAFYDH